MALAIFLVTYLFIAGARLPFSKLDRPGGALAGAVLMVVLGIVSPEEVFREAIDFDTIVLLLGMMILASYLTHAAFFRTAGWWAVRLARTPGGLLFAVCAISGVLSAFLVNDTICLMLTPLVLATAEDAEVPPAPYLLGLCMASNAGSAATFTGNPQNMLIGISSGIPYAEFAAWMALPAVLGTLCVFAIIRFMFRGELKPRVFAARPPPPPLNRKLLALTLLALAGVIAAFFAGLPMGWSAIAGAAFVMALSTLEPREALEKVDFILLLFFASLFVVVHGVHKEGWAEAMRGLFEPLMAGGALQESFGFASLTLVASNLFSNVPWVMLARHWVPQMTQPELGWQVLALSSTLAGNLTLIGSVANLIVFELARGKVQMSFWRYLKVGVPVTLLSLAVGLGTLLLEHWVLR